MVLGTLTGINVLNYFDRYVLPAVLPLVIAALHLSDLQAGALQSSFILVYALASPLAGWLGDRGPRLRIAAAGVFVWSLATFASGLAPTFVTLFAVRALIGIGEAAYAAVTPSLVADVVPPGRRGAALALFYAAIPVGSATGYMVGGMVGQAYGYERAFFVAGGPGLLFAFALLLMREPRRGTYDVATRTAAPTSGWRATAAALRARPSYLANTAAQTIYTFSIGGLAVWMPTYFVRERGLALSRAGFLFGAVLSAAGFVGTLLGGVLGDRLARRSRAAPFVFSGWALIASVPFTALAVLAPAPAVYWSAMFVTLLLLFLNTGPLNAAMTDVLPPDLRGQGFGLYALVMHVFGDAFSPPLIGWASDGFGGLRLPVLATGLLMPLAGLVLLVSRHHLQRDLARAAGESA